LTARFRAIKFARANRSEGKLKHTNGDTEMDTIYEMGRVSEETHGKQVLSEFPIAGGSQP